MGGDFDFSVVWHSLAADQSRPILTDEQIETGAHRIRVRSSQPLEDLALYYMLFATGARPLEIARLEVRDYLESNGDVRCVSVVREEVAINARSRPLYFRSVRLDNALEPYLAARVRSKAELENVGHFRGLNPRSRLFLSASSQGFEVIPIGKGGTRRFLCRGIQEAYRKLFQYAEFERLTAMTARYTVAERLYLRGADDSQVGLLLGIAERSAVRQRFPRRLQSLEELTKDLV